MEAIIGETIEDEAVEAVEFVVVVVIMRLLEAATELLKFVELVFVGILVAVVGMTRVGCLVEAVAVVVEVSGLASFPITVPEH